MQRLPLAVTTLTLLVIPAAGQAQERIVPERWQRAYETYHYAPAVRVGNTVYLSGVVAPAADPETQFTHVFEQLVAVLQDAGASLADVVEMTTFHVNMSEHVQTFITVKDRFMSEPYPAWTAIGVDQLFSPRALVEVKVIAVISDGD